MTRSLTAKLLCPGTAQRGTTLVLATSISTQTLIAVKEKLTTEHLSVQCSNTALWTVLN